MLSAPPLHVLKDGRGELGTRHKKHTYTYIYTPVYIYIHGYDPQKAA